MMYLFTLFKIITALTERELEIGIKNFLESKSKEIDEGIIDPDEIFVSVEHDSTGKEKVFMKFNKVENIYNKEDLSRIPLGYKLNNLLIQNLDVLQSSLVFKNKIDKILIYEKEKNVFYDYFNVLKFEKKENEYFDTSGVFKGKLFKNIKEILDNGIFTEIGFIQDKNITQEERVVQSNVAIEMLRKILRDKKLDLYKNLYKPERRNVFDIIKLDFSNKTKFISLDKS